MKLTRRGPIKRVVFAVNMTKVRRTPDNSATPVIRWTAQAVLLGAAGLAIAAAFGPIWVVRTGIAIAIIGGVVALSLAVRQARRVWQRSESEGRENVRREVRARSEERKQTGEVLDMMSTYNDDLAAANDRLEDQRRRTQQEVAGLKSRIGVLQSEVSTLRGSNASLKSDLADRAAVLEGLQQTLAAREAELSKLRNAEDDAAVVQMDPRAGEAGEADLWPDDDHPTVANMSAAKIADADHDRAADDTPQVREA